jgi:hypothetical protein
MSSPHDRRLRTDIAPSLNIGIGWYGAGPRQLAAVPSSPCKPADAIAEARPPYRKAGLDAPAGVPTVGRLSSRSQRGEH